MNSCQAPHAEHIVDIIESLRELVVSKIGPYNNQDKLAERVFNPSMKNPYGVPNSTNEELKKTYGLPDNAEWVYFIGCTSNYRQQSLRDNTLQFFKKIGLDFTLIDESCCTSPLIRTGQVKELGNVIESNLEHIKHTSATKIVTSCAGCYRTIKKDFKKFGYPLDFEVYHTIELIDGLLKSKQLKIQGKYEKTITYHDPCHLGRHLNIYEIPRNVLKQIPGLKLVEMKRNRQFSWCCGAGGGVKIGYPDWAVEISKERIQEALDVNATALVSTCPFCKTNLSDANNALEANLEVIDVIEILNSLEIQSNLKHK
jgi:heterodisulfide reductase subunit D